MFELLVLFCQDEPGSKCPLWSPQEPYASVMDCREEAKTIEDDLRANGVKGVVVECKPLSPAKRAHLKERVAQNIRDAMIILPQKPSTRTLRF